jgi:hypothetical protein
MGASPRLNLKLSYPGAVEAELVTRKSELEAALTSSTGRARDLHDTDNSANTTEQVLRIMISSFGRGSHKKAFALMTTFVNANIPPSKRLPVFLDILNLLDVRIDSLARNILARAYPARG